MFIKWDKSLETGVAFVDADHRVLINLLNQVDDCVEQREETTIIGSVLDALVEYTDYHFKREEKMMELSGYEGLDSHARTHKTLHRQVQTISRDFREDPLMVRPVEVREFLRTWLIDHIMVHDFDYRAVCATNAEAAQAAGRLPFLNGKDGVAFTAWDQIRIMLVDDNVNFRTLIHTLLKAVGVRNLDLIETPEAGLAKLAQRPADVVLCDWVMDDMNGAEFARKVEEMDLPSRIVLMTGYSVDVLKGRSTDVNISDYLEKPVRTRDLLASISKAALSLDIVPHNAG